MQQMRQTGALRVARPCRKRKRERTAERIKAVSDQLAAKAKSQQPKQLRRMNADIRGLN
jgi:hypothetical protein